MKRQVGRIELSQLLGRGGMGEVYEGWDKTLERSVAVKCLSSVRRTDRLNRARFLQEARILSKLDHPHICQIYDLIREDDHDYLVLELIDGCSLREGIKKNPERRTKLRIALQIAKVLVAAHAEGVVHRDLKPDNVMLTDGDQVKVLDFGIAQSISAVQDNPADIETIDDWGPRSDDDQAFTNPVKTRAGAVMGTPRYMSPEQARGEPITPASDMFAFGLILQEMFSGLSSYERQQSRAELMVQVSEGRSRPVAGLGRALNDLVRRLKANNAGDRPTAKETLDRLQRIVDRPRRWAIRAAVAVVVISAVAGAAKYTHDLRRERTVAVQAHTQAESLVTFMLEDLAQELRPLGRLSVLEKVARRAMQHYETSPSESLPEAAFNRGRAYAMASTVLGDRGDLWAALNAGKGAVSILRELVEAEPDNLRFVNGLAKALIQESDILSQSDEPEPARTALNEARELAARAVDLEPGKDEWLETLAETWYSEGLLRMWSDQEPDPEPFQRAIALYEELARRKPEHTPYSYRLAVLHGQGLSQVFGIRHEEELSFASVEIALELFTKVVATDPGNSRWQFGYSWEIRRWAQHLKKRGRSEEALDAFRHALEISQRLIDLEPDNVSWQNAAAIDRAAIASILADQGQLDRARVELDGSLTQQRRIVAREPRSVENVCSLVADMLFSGELYQRQSLGRQAVGEWTAALSLLQPFSDNENEDVWVRELRIMAMVLLGRSEEVEQAISDMVGRGQLARNDGSHLAQLLNEQGLEILFEGQ